MGDGLGCALSDASWFKCPYTHAAKVATECPAALPRAPCRPAPCFSREHALAHRWQLDVTPHGRKLVLTMSPLESMASRERAVRLLFDRFPIEALCVCDQAKLALYAAGLTTGAVLVCGEGETRAVVCVDDEVRASLHVGSVSGVDLTERLNAMLWEVRPLLRLPILRPLGGLPSPLPPYHALGRPDARPYRRTPPTKTTTTPHIGSTARPRPLRHHRRA